MPRKKKQPENEPQTLEEVMQFYSDTLRKLATIVHEKAGISFQTTIIADYEDKKTIGFHPHRDDPPEFLVTVDTQITFN